MVSLKYLGSVKTGLVSVDVDNGSLEMFVWFDLNRMPAQMESWVVCDVFADV